MPPTKGEIKLNGVPLTSQSEKARLAYRFNRIGFILQNSNLIPFLTVTEQLRLVDKVARRPFQQEHAQKLLAEFGLTRVSKTYPSDLSGGERQQGAIVRALYNHPSLDVARSQEAHEHQKAILMVTHNQRLLGDYDVVYRIGDGIMTRSSG